MKIFAGVAVSLTLLLSAEEIARPELIFKEGTTVNYIGEFDFTPGEKQKYTSSFHITQVTRDGVNSFCSATMTYALDDVPAEGTYLLQFACDSLNYYVLAQNFLYREMETVEMGRDATSGDSLVYPLRMKVGDTLPNAWCKTFISNSEGTTVGLMEFTRRKVESLDTLNLGCGKVPAYRISGVQVMTSNVNSKYSGKREEKDYVTFTEWFSPRLGIVKSQDKSPHSISVIALERYSDK